MNTSKLTNREKELSACYLRELMKQYHLSEIKLATLLNVHRTYISQILRCKRSISTRQAQAIIDLFKHIYERKIPFIKLYPAKTNGSVIHLKGLNNVRLSRIQALICQELRISYKTDTQISNNLCINKGLIRRNINKLLKLFNCKTKQDIVNYLQKTLDT